MKNKLIVSLAGAVALLALACGAPPAEDLVEPFETAAAAPTYDPGPPPRAVASLVGTEGSGISGTVTFEPAEEGIVVTAEVQGVEPGSHGIHLHEIGDCSATDFSSAGGHFNPTGVDHGSPDREPHHAGDFGNIEIGEDGTGTLELTSGMLTVEEGEGSVLGRAVVFHAGRDDLESQPAGASGPRLACGVVEAETAAAEETSGEDEMAGDEDPMAGETEEGAV